MFVSNTLHYSLDIFCMTDRTSHFIALYVSEFLDEGGERFI